MTTHLQTYRSKRGAENFAKRLKIQWPHKLFQVSCGVSPTFHDIWYVEVFVDDVRGKPAWVGVEPLSRAVVPR